MILFEGSTEPERLSATTLADAAYGRLCADILGSPSPDRCKTGHSTSASSLFGRRVTAARGVESLGDRRFRLADRATRFSGSTHFDDRP